MPFILHLTRSVLLYGQTHTAHAKTRLKQKKERSEYPTARCQNKHKPNFIAHTRGTAQSVSCCKDSH